MTVPLRTAMEAAPDRGRLETVALQVLEIGHDTHVALLDADTAFWALAKRKRAADLLSAGPLWEAFAAREAEFALEMDRLRFHLKPSAVYFNPTERCNLNCSYCYIPSAMRRDGKHMEPAQLLDALDRLYTYFRGHMPQDRKPQVIFHGAEPLLNKAAVFAGIRAFKDRFRFGVQTNATMLDDAAIEFLTANAVGIGLSLDGPVPAVADRTRHGWNGTSAYDAVIRAIEKLDGYAGFNVICTMTQENLPHLTEMVEFLHASRVPAGHPEGYIEGFTQLYTDLAEQISARMERRKANPAALLVPGIDEGMAGMRFIEAVVKSSARNSAWVKL